MIPNWAPLEEIQPVTRANDWSHEHGLDEVRTLLYSGTLGLKHDPALLVALARQVIDAGQPVQLVVVNQGPAEQVLRDEAARLDVPLLLLPFQPYERLSDVLGSGDVLVVLLEQDAGAFSVPSKTLSYLCAGRPVLGLMPAENLAATLVSRVEGCVLPPGGRLAAGRGRVGRRRCSPTTSAGPHWARPRGRWPSRSSSSPGAPTASRTCSSAALGSRQPARSRPDASLATGARSDGSRGPSGRTPARPVAPPRQSSLAVLERARMARAIGTHIVRSHRPGSAGPSRSRPTAGSTADGGRGRTAAGGPA